MIHIFGTFVLPLVASVGVKRSTFLSTQAAGSFGPNDCVSVERSSTGTCVLRTQCPSEVNLETTEFAFLCVLSGGEVQKHSYGQGGFDPEETYDSSVACEQCLGPNQTPQVAFHATGHAAAKESEASNKAEVTDEADESEQKTEAEFKAPAAAPASAPAKGPKGLPVDLHTDGAPWKNESAREKYLKVLVAKPPHNISYYGPDNCVSTYLGEKGTCVMETKCTGESIKDHELGLTCVEKDGKSARHLFGKNAFNPEETFDTLIDCEICLGLDVAKLDKPMSIKDTIVSLKTEVEELKTSMEGVTADVKKLNGKVFPEKEGAAKEPEKGFVMHSRESKTHHVKHASEEMDDEVQDRDAETEERAEEADDDEVPKHHPHHKGHKKHHKKHHGHKHHRHAHHVHHDEDEEEQPVQEDNSVQEVREDEPVEDSDAQSASDSESDGW